MILYINKEKEENNKRVVERRCEVKKDNSKTKTKKVTACNQQNQQNNLLKVPAQRKE